MLSLRAAKETEMVRVDMQHSMNHFIHVHQALQQSASFSESTCDRALLLGKLCTAGFHTAVAGVQKTPRYCSPHAIDFADASPSDLHADPNSESGSEVELFNDDFVSGSKSDSKLDIDSDC